MLKAWRIVREKYAPSAFSGAGAAEFGGRWNLPGTRMVYTSESQSLAALELLVHLNPPQSFRYRAFWIQFEENLVEVMSRGRLPDDWAVEPPTVSTQRLGTRWARESRSAILATPSAIIATETNYLINPLHADFAKIKIGQPEDFVFDRRLIE